MKSKLSILASAALMLAMCASFGALLPSCQSADSRAQLSRLADTVLAAGVLTGKINPQQAELIREGGKLVLDAIDGKEPQIAALSEVALKAAVESKAITPAEAELLTSAGTVPLPSTIPPDLAGSPVPTH